MELAKQVIGALIRTVMASVGGGVLANGLVTSSDIDTVVGALCVVGATGWSIFKKWQANKSTPTA